MTATTEVKPAGSEVNDLIQKFDADYSTPRNILGVWPIIMILAAWVVVFCLYGRQFIAAVAPLAR